VAKLVEGRASGKGFAARKRALCDRSHILRIELVSAITNRVSAWEIESKS